MPSQEDKHDTVSAPTTSASQVRAVPGTTSSDVVPGTALAVLAAATGAITVAGDYRGWTNRLLIAGTTGNQYTVSMRISDNVWGCSCPGWIFSRRCQHLDAMLPSLIKAFPGSTASPPLQRLNRAPRAPTRVIATPVDAEEARSRRLLAIAMEDHPGETDAERLARLKQAIRDDAVRYPPGQAVMMTSPRGLTAGQASQDRTPPPLTDAELKRRERIRRITSGEAYKKVTPGSREAWVGMAAAFARGDVNFVPDARAYHPKTFVAKVRHSPVLAALFLDAMPASMAELRVGYRQAVMRIFRESEFNDTAPAYVTGFTRVTTAFEALRRAKGWL
jgi:hypothetical protein